jgi:hypothetical protein
MGISVSALQSTPLSEFSFDERMSWPSVLEALGWMGKIAEGIYTIAALESIALVSLLWIL